LQRRGAGKRSVVLRERYAPDRRQNEQQQKRCDRRSDAPPSSPCLCVHVRPPPSGRPSAPEADQIPFCIKGFPGEFAKDWNVNPHFARVRLFAHNPAPWPDGPADADATLRPLERFPNAVGA
jgi:hypothetical protein